MIYRLMSSLSVSMKQFVSKLKLSLLLSGTPRSEVQEEVECAPSPHLSLTLKVRKPQLVAKYSLIPHVITVWTFRPLICTDL